MGANKEPKAMQAAVDQLEAAKRSREERAGANKRREAQPSSQGPKTFDALIAGLEAATRNRKEQQAAERRPLSEPTPVDAGPPPRDDYFSPDRFAAMGGDLNALAEMQNKVKGGITPSGWTPNAPTPTPARNDYFDRDRFAAMGGDLNKLDEIRGNPRTPDAPSPTPARNDYFDRDRFNEMRERIEERRAGRRKSLDERRKSLDERRRRQEEFKRELIRRRRGIDFGPGRGRRIEGRPVDRNIVRGRYEDQMNTGVSPFGGSLGDGDFINPEDAKRGQQYLDFMKRIMRQKQGQFDR